MNLSKHLVVFLCFSMTVSQFFIQHELKPVLPDSLPCVCLVFCESTDGSCLQDNSVLIAYNKLKVESKAI